MPNIAPMVLEDRTEPTPVERTFEPDDRQGGVSTFTTRDEVPMGRHRLTFGRRIAGDKAHYEVRLSQPAVEVQTINGVSRPVVMYVNWATAKFTLSKHASADEVNNLVGLFVSSLAGDSLIGSAIVDGEAIY